MKYLLLIFTCLLLSLSPIQASHVIGGEIGWTCLSNGKYQFKMKVYIDCAGANWGYNNTSISIAGGNPYPTNESGTPFNSIVMKPDSNRWIANSYGDTSPTCTSQYGSPYSCANRDQGTIIQFFYLSDPITLKGVPSRRGWNFFWESVCCRPSTNVKNINTAQFGGNMLLRAAMYPTKNRDNASPCIDSSPLFKSEPNTMVCRGSEFSYSLSAIDIDLDSVSYSWDRSYNDPIDDPEPVPFLPGFSQDNPTPDTTFDPRNLPATIDPLSGLIKMGIYSGSGVEKFYTVVEVNSYREGTIISTVFRELPFTTFACPKLPSKEVNNPPKIKFNGVETDNYELNVSAGQDVKVDIEVLDSDITGVGTQKQALTMVPEGLLFSRDKQTQSPCQINYGAGGPLLLEPCAFMQNSSPLLDTNLKYPTYSIKDTSYIKSQFVWQPDCKHVFGSGKLKTYYFYFNVQDDHCPIPGSLTSVLKVKVHKGNSWKKASMKCITETNGVNEITWNLNEISAISLTQWYVYGSSTESGPYQLLGSVPANAPLSYLDSDVSTSNQYYYVRAKNYGCDSVISTSLPSDTINNTSDALKAENSFDCVLLTWNQERSSYASDEFRKYYVYRETQTSSGFELIDSVLNTNQYCDKTNSCGAMLRYFVTADLSTDICNFNVDTVSITLAIENLNSAVKVLNNTLVAKDVNGNYQWYDCHVKRIISGETAQTFIPKDTGSYALILSRFGCSDTSKCIPLFPVGIAPLPLSQQLTYYPNPTSGKLNINLDQKTASMQVQVRNIQGQLLKKLQFVNSNNFQLELPQDAGIYFIQLTNQKGERANLKVVKQ